MSYNEQIDAENDETRSLPPMPTTSTRPSSHDSMTRIRSLLEVPFTRVTAVVAATAGFELETGDDTVGEMDSWTPQRLRLRDQLGPALREAVGKLDGVPRHLQSASRMMLLLSHVLPSFKTWADPILLEVIKAPPPEPLNDITRRQQAMQGAPPGLGDRLSEGGPLEDFKAGANGATPFTVKKDLRTARAQAADEAQGER